MRGRALVALVLGALALAGCGGGTKTVTQTTTVVHTTIVRVTTSAPPSSGASEACTGNATSGTFKAIAGSAGAGNVSYRLRVVNASPVACYVSGLPQVQLIGSDGNDVPTSVIAAQPGTATAARIVLESGAAATADARFSPDVPGVGEGNAGGSCEPKATKLRVGLGGAPLDVAVDPPTPVCEHGQLQFSLFTAAG